MSESETKLRILVVEDSLLTADQIWESLQRLSVPTEITMVRSEHDALSAAREFRPHVVLLDLKLSEGTGFAVLKQLSSMELAPKPVVVVMTNYALPNYRNYALLIGAKYFLDKARDLELLPTLVQSIANQLRGPTG